jgi:glycosyltransferase involved in cell wall biosynthesis
VLAEASPGSPTTLPQSGSPEKLVFFWVMEFDYGVRAHHGGYLRYFALSRELIRMGHEVYFVAALKSEEYDAGKAWFSSLKAQGTITDFTAITYEPRLNRVAWAARLLHPFAGNVLLAADRANVLRQVSQFGQQHPVDVIVASSRNLFFIADEFRDKTMTIIDFCDAESLYFWREARHAIANRNYRQAVRHFFRMLQAAVHERYYCRRSDLNILVSPADKRAIDRIGGLPRQTMFMPNGLTLAGAGQDLAAKQSNRIIFTGNMDFPPNSDAAIYFLDFVFPLVQRDNPTVEFVIAGANPTPELMARQNDHVRLTGYVKNLNHEIATSALYVAPLVTGSGFKNKIAEAIVNRTFIIATPIAVEFLDAPIRSLIEVAATPEEMAQSITKYLRNPELTLERVEQLYQLVVNDQNSWAQRARDLLAMMKVAKKPQAA